MLLCNRVGLSSPTELAAISDSKNAIYAWGEIRYRDIFQRCQLTKFRVFAHGRPDAEGVWHMQIAPGGNAATDPFDVEAIKKCGVCVDGPSTRIRRWGEQRHLRRLDSAK